MSRANLKGAEMANNTFPLTQNQTAIWLDEIISGDKTSYIIGGYVEIRHDLNTDAFRQALKKAVAETDALGISIRLEAGKPVQTISAQLNYELPFLDFSDSEEARDGACLAWIKKQFDIPMITDRAPLFECALLKAGAGHFFWLMKSHHLIFDNSGFTVFANKLDNFYHDFATGASFLNEQQSPSFQEYARQENSYQNTEPHEADRNYWIEKFKQLPPPLLEKKVNADRLPAYLEKNWFLPREVQASLEALAKEMNVSLPQLWLGILATYFHKITQGKTVCFGLHITNRYTEQEENTIGLFTGVVPLLLNMPADLRFEQLLLQIKNTRRSDRPHQRFSLVELVSEVRHLSSSPHPLFDISINYYHVPIDLKNLDSEFIWLKQGGECRQPMTIFLTPCKKDNKFELKLAFLPEYCPEYAAEKMIQRLEVLIHDVIQNPDQALHSINILPEDERQLVLHGFNNTAADFPGDKTIIQLFEEQVKKTPGNVAVIFEDKKLTYRELNEKANRVGHHLRENFDIQGDDIIALQMGRSEWMIVAILGVMKSGAAYLPIDPEAPEARMGFMLRDSAAKVLITDAAVYPSAEKLTDILPVLSVEDIRYEKSGNPLCVNTSKDLAYIIYTSGSTGMPKGVMVEHRGVVNFVQKPIQLYEVSPSDRILQFSTYTFDTCIAEIFLGLFTGAALVVPQSIRLTVDAFVKLVRDCQITILDLPPKFLNALNKADLGSARILTLGGEAPDLNALRHYSQKYRCFNAYGPTEATVAATLFEVPKSWDKSYIPIGKPVHNTEIYILSIDNTLNPLGIAGELCISGAGLARGYLNNPELTAQKFIPHPFQPGERLYKSGDLARWLPDGNIEFLGRIDHQLKIRGYRIEAGEIEQALLEHPAIQSAVVIGKEMEQGKELVAYLVAADQALPGVENLRQHLAEQLPSYMIPAHFVELEALPLTTSGKVDRKALPDPEAGSLASGTAYMAPRNTEEQILLDIWKAVLRRGEIGIHDNFFHIGGDSIKAIQITARLGAHQLSLSIRDLFAQPTIARLAPLMRRLEKAYPQGAQQGKLPLTPIQRWFFEERQIDPHHFNQAFRLSNRERLSEEALRQSLQHLLGHHDMLRATYRHADGELLQQVEAHKEVDLLVADFRETSAAAREQSIEQIADAAQAGFDLAAGPLLKAILVRQTECDELVLIIHHLAVDGVSWRILIEDLDHCYARSLAGKTIQLPPKTAPFSMWAAQMQQYAQSKTLLAELPYWQKLDGQTVANLPVDRPEGRKLADDTTQLGFQLDEAQTLRLTAGAHRAYNTEINDLLLAALSRALRQTFGGQDYAITLEGHGREDILDLDTSRTVGWFTSAFPHVLEHRENTSMHLQNIKENLRHIPNKGVGYGILRYLSKAGLTEKNKAAISFNYLGAFTEGEAQGAFTFSDGGAGQAHSPRSERDHEMDVSGILMQGRLQMSVSYSAGRMERTRMQALVDAYQAALLELVAHCEQQTAARNTPGDFTACDWTLEQYHRFLLENDLAAEQVADIYPLSPLQEGMLFHKMMDGDSDAYFIQLALDLQGEVEMELFKKSWARLIQRHSVLRTAFYSQGLQQPMQVVKKTVDLPLQYQDLGHLDAGAQEAVIARYLQSDREKGFALNEESLLRLILFRQGENAHRLVISNHHIITDGWSGPILIKEWIDLYEGHQLDGEVRYAPFIAWLQTRDEEKGAAFWQHYLAGYAEKSGIPTLKEGPAQGQDKEWGLELSPEQTRGLEQMAARSGVSLNTVMQGIWAVILSKYNQREDVVFGMTTSGRSAGLSNIEQLTGLFINTVPVRIQLDAAASFADLLDRIHRQSIESREHEHHSLAKIQAAWPGAGDLFDHILVFENYPVDEGLGENKRKLAIKRSRGYERTHYGFDLAVIPGKQLTIRLTYHTGNLAEDMVMRMGGHIGEVVNSVLTQPEQPVGQIDILPQAERQLLLHDFNPAASGTDFPKDKTIIQLFEEQVRSTPDNVAVIFGDKELTYRELNEKANRVGHHLRENFDIQGDDIIALQMGRSEWMIVAILGVMKSGAAYLPIDPEAPEARMGFMLRDSAAKVLITDAAVYPSAEKLTDILPVLSVEDIRHEKSGNPLCINTSQNLAYIIYTSGSTGMPKGVMVEHRSFINFNSHYKLEHHITSLTCNYIFDVSVMEIFSPLLSGSRLVIPTSTIVLSPEQYAFFLNYNRISHAYLHPMHLKSIADELEHYDKVYLKRLLIGVEPIPEKNIYWYKQKGISIINGYGPSETTICSTMYKENGSSDTKSNINLSIGKPLSNTSILIVNTQGTIMPLGIAGELCISGIGLARGYLNNPELTAQKFIPHPFKPGERLYKTGDLARWLPDGNIEFLGRIDHQLKIRGYRIEAGEIEQALLAHPAIGSAVVIGKEMEQGKELVAYLVAAGQPLPDVESLRQHLAGQLPSYMIPAHFVELEALPLTTSGKVDRKALPDPEMGSLASGTAYVAARNAVEAALVDLWENVLQRTGIGIYDNFFDLGGHSLRAIRVIALVHQKLSAKVALSELFAHPTIAALGQIIAEKDTLLFQSIEPISEQASYPLSNAQRRLWVLDQLEENMTAYNMPAAVRLDGTLQARALEQAFESLLNRHEILRTRFVAGEDGTPRQVVAPIGAFHLPCHDWREKDEFALEAYIQAHAGHVFDLSKGNLLQAELLRTGAESHVLLLNMHHIISDGWSMNLLFAELSARYDAAAKGLASPFADLRIQYKDYAAWQNHLLSDHDRTRELRQYWQQQLADLPTLELPADHPRPLVKSYRGGLMRHTFGPRVVERLDALARASGASLFMTLTALVKVLLHRYTGQEDLLIGTPTAGRNHPDLHDQLGFYVNTLVLRDQVQGTDRFVEVLEKVKQTALAAFERELYPFDQLVEELDLARDQSRNPIFDVMVVLQNNEQSDLRLGDIGASALPGASKVSKFDLTFAFAADPSDLHFEVEYSADLFGADRIQRLIGHFDALVNSVLAGPEQPVDQIDILPHAERQLLLHDFNDTRADFPADKTIIQLFEEQVEKTPDNIAVIFGDKQLTYRQLNEQANQLGHYLRETYHIQPDDLIALLMERSEWMIVAILGVIKSGAAYLPIDPEAPGARTAYMLRDSNAKALLTDASTYEPARELASTLPVLAVEKIRHKKIGNPVGINTTRDLAYLIYTSGSTGQPKGVMLEHQGVVNMSLSQIRQFGLSSGDRVLQFANYTFDAAVSEILMALFSGTALVLARKEATGSPSDFLASIAKRQVSVATLPPAFLASLAQQDLANIRVLITAGEKPVQKDVAHYGSQLRYFNAFGPTECSVCVSIYEVAQPIPSPVPIGKPIDNTHLYILSSVNEVLPIGVAGELCISGSGLARGYLNNPELTAQKFVPHPFREGERLYKTGDLARWLPDGNIEFLGRIDHQLKIRGHRIEAGEIEQTLLRHPAIRSAVVVGKDLGQGKELVAYLVAGDEPMPDVEGLRRHLSEQLPAYMVPAHFVALEALPLTTSGKVDRKALPDPEAGGLATGTAYMAPRNGTEAALVDLWETVLQRTDIGVCDNFFDLGGHSLKAIRLSAEISGKFALAIPVKLIFQHPAIAALAAKMGEHKDHRHEEGICYNPGAARTLFAFPPIFGLAVRYETLAAHCPQVSWYCFDFLEAENRLELYYQQIKRQQPEGPYLFFGYSAGGNLAFEMAQFMENRGDLVGDIIFGDSAIRLAKTDFDFKTYIVELREYAKTVQNEQISLLLQNEMVLKQSEKRVTTFHDFLNDISMSRSIQANIHQILAEKEEGPDDLAFTHDWDPHTQRDFKIYQAEGKHGDMFDPPHLEKNAAILNAILQQIAQPTADSPNGTGNVLFPWISPEAETALVVAIGQLATAHFDQGGSPDDFDPADYRETFPAEVAALEGFWRQATDETAYK